MAWSIEEIEKNFLNSKVDTLALTPETVLASFERVERVLGRDWISAQTTGKGLLVTMPIIGMGLRLGALDGIPNAATLIEHLRLDTQNADAELTAIYLLRSSRPSVEVELYPEVEGRRADFRVRNGD